MTNFLGNVVVLDIEGKLFHATIDGQHKKMYTFEEFLECKHLLDHPGYNAVTEAAHLMEKPESRTDRGAQPFTRAERERYLRNLHNLNQKQWLLPGGLAKRVMFEMGRVPPQDACIAWWKFCDTQPKIADMVRLFRSVTDRDRRRNLKLNEARADASHRIDYLANNKYISDETENCRAILTAAYEAGAISDDILATFDIRILKSGPRKGLLEFKERRVIVMSLYVAACAIDGSFRRDDRGQKIGLKTVLGGILQHHHFKSGKNSKGSARAKTRKHLQTLEDKYRAENKIPFVKGDGFPPAIPSVRSHHQKMNRKLVQILRDYSI